MLWAEFRTSQLVLEEGHSSASEMRELETFSADGLF